MAFKNFLDSINDLFSTDILGNSNKIIEKLKAEKIGGLFCLSAYIIRYISEDVCKRDFFKNIILVLPDNIAELTRLLNLITTNGFIEKWNFKEFYYVYDEKGHSFTILDDIEKLYAILILSNFKSSDQNIKIENDLNEIIYSWLSDSHSVFYKTLDDLHKNPEKYAQLIEISDLSDRIDKCKELFKNASKAYENIKLEKIRKAEIDNNRKESFIAQLFCAYEEIFTLKRFLTLTKTNNNLWNKDKAFGFNVLLGKDMFIKNPFVTFNLGAEEMGRTLAKSENIKIFEQLLQNCIKGNSFNAVQKYLDDNKKNIDHIIMIACNANLCQITIPGHRHFKEVYQIENAARRKLAKSYPKVDQFYETNGNFIPIYSIYGQSDAENIEDKIIITNKKCLSKMKLEQVKPENPHDKYDNFEISLTSCSSHQELIKDIINTKPNWLIKEGDEENQEKYLKLRVLFEMYEQFKFELPSDFTGILIDISQMEY